MSRSAVKEINAEFQAEERFLDSIQTIAREACAAAGLSRKETNGVAVAIEEGATNIIRHAYLYEKGTIRLRVVIYPKLITFSLIDTGRSFQPDTSARVDLQRLVESGRRGGLGFYMIQKIMDSVEYSSTGGFNELRMIKRLSPQKGGGAAFLVRLGTLRAKFSVYTFVIMAIILGGAFYYLNRSTLSGLYEGLDAMAAALASTVADQAAGHVLNNRSDAEFVELVDSYVRANAGLISRLVIVDSLNQILADSKDPEYIRTSYHPPPDVLPAAFGSPQRLGPEPSVENYLIVPFGGDAQRLGSIHVIYSSASLHQQFSQKRSNALWLVGGLIGVGLVGIYLLSNYFVNPIVKISQRVRRFSAGDMTTELPLEGADEFFEISSALNDMMTRIARDQKSAIERERVAREIELTSHIQKALLPQSLPDIPGLDLHAFYRAAALVGGDLFDIVDLGDNRYCLTVADVSGKGLPASLVMSMLRTAIQITSRTVASPRLVLDQVNRHLISNLPSNMFITVLLAIYDARSRTLQLVSAGHNPLLLSRSSGPFLRLNPKGMPLGVTDHASLEFGGRLEEMTIELAPGDLFVIYTDGVTEATNRESRQYGMSRLLEVLAAGRSLPSSREVGEHLIHDLDQFTGESKQSDDITFIIGRCSPTDLHQLTSLARQEHPR